MALFERKRRFPDGHIYLYDGIWPTIDSAEDRITELRSEGYEARLTHERISITQEDVGEGRERPAYVTWKRRS